MSKNKPVRYATVVETYLCASGYETLPAGTVRVLPGNIKTTVIRSALASHTPFSPPSLLNLWNLDANGIHGKQIYRTAVHCNGQARHINDLFAQHVTTKQAA